MRVLGIDWGNKRLGLAISDLSGTIANPLPFIARKGDVADIARIGELIREYEVERIVVGIPLGQDGLPGEAARAAQKFSALLEEALNLPVDNIDERYSTHAAERTLLEADMSRSKRKGLRDGVAAAWFLQAYLDSKEKTGHER